MKPLRILVGAAVPPDPNSGAAGTVYHTNEALRELGHEVDEIWADDLPRRIQHGNLHYLLELPRRYRDAVRRKTAEKDYDVIQLSQPHAWLAARDHRRSRRPGVFVIRSHGIEQRVDEDVRRYGDPDAGRSWPKRALSGAMSRALRRHQRLAIRHADAMIVGCCDDRDYLIERMGADPECVAAIPHGAPQRYIDEPALPFTSSRLKKILYVGQFAYFKAPHVLTESLRPIFNAHSDASLTWVCGRSHHSTVRRMLDPFVMPRVQFEGWRPQEALMNLYDEHGLFLFPSLAEGFGKAFLEAMSRGLCVVAANTSGMKDCIVDAESGMLVPPGEPQAMARVATRVMDDKDLATRLSEKSRAFAVTCTWKRCAEEAVEYYRCLLSAAAVQGPVHSMRVVSGRP